MTPYKNAPPKKWEVPDASNHTMQVKLYSRNTHEKAFGKYLK